MSEPMNPCCRALERLMTDAERLLIHMHDPDMRYQGERRRHLMDELENAISLARSTIRQAKQKPEARSHVNA